MQQVQLFTKQNNIKISRWNILLNSNLIDKNIYIADLELPSGKFIIKYSFLNNKISSFEILDYIWYVYFSISMVKNIRNLLQVILLKNH